MTPESDLLTAPQKAYLYLLRAMGWIGLSFVVLFGFGCAMGVLRPEVPVFVIALASAPGILISLFLAGTPNRPTFLLRPTSFLKAFFVCGIFLGLASTGIVIQTFAMVAALDMGELFAGLGFPEAQQLFKSALGGLGVDRDIARFQAVLGFDLAVAVALVYPGALVANLAAIVGWFIRFAPNASPRETVVPRRPRTQAYDEEKARALRAMRLRQVQSRAS